MIEIVRIENPENLSSYRATKNEEHAIQLELMIEFTKAKKNLVEWHPLISTPFRYNPPHTKARFRLPYGRNVFYGSLLEETALYECAFYLMKERMHLTEMDVDIGTRTIFFVDANNDNSVDIRNDKNYLAIMNKKDYSFSHQFISANPKVTFLRYPSCRDPQQRDNVAILDIKHFDKNPKWQESIKFFYDNEKKLLSWIDYQLHIDWAKVS